MTGEAGFNEVLFDQAVVPDAMRLDDVGKGWTVAIIKKNIVQSERIRLLSAEEHSSEHQENCFIDEHREIIPIINSVENTAADNGGNAKKYKNP